MTEEVEVGPTVVLAKTRGLLVIGDPLLGGGRRIGRVDDVWGSALDKLRQAISIAIERNLQPVIVADLLHETRDIGQLVPIIEIFKDKKPILVPRNCRWEEQNQGHVAAILEKANLTYIAGRDADRFQLNHSSGGKAKKMEVTCHTCWGGAERLEFGSRAFLRIPAMNLTIVHSNSLPLVDSSDGQTLLVAGRLLRLGPSEESQKVYVHEVTADGIEAIPLELTPIVFSGVSNSAEAAVNQLRNASLFVEMLRKSTEDIAEESGRESLLELIDEVCDSNKHDDYIRQLLLQLAKDTLEQETSLNS
ncbi:hypothetical protein HNP46_000189 [Pseudomonas nitritireducens]|uniref:Uncharacterized protein n=1 Tax=Pseudomonas nitroreducens TaxID=46680 RepID=A0A7W7KFX3_PSENT|nr:hypothetical protein [Pseudomonas nitritireducens]MBB4861378.1 hypothetical protein [Pseudomonas nitritireducens]